MLTERMWNPQTSANGANSANFSEGETAGVFLQGEETLRI
jgi:hypothetical protein